MKKLNALLLCSLFLSSAVFAQSVYRCPQQVICSSGTCHLPVELINPYPSTQIANLTYNFFKSSTLPQPMCEYYVSGGNGAYANQQFYLNPTLNPTPNTSSQPNYWLVGKNGSSLCPDSNPNNCPWSVSE